MAINKPSNLTPVLCWMEALRALGSSFLNSWNMNILSWNCREAANQNFLNHVLDLKRMHSPAIMLIMEIKLTGDKAQAIASRIFQIFTLWIRMAL
ncbi:hypothetical protein SLA2020_245580 [Shorea laevis]